MAPLRAAVLGLGQRGLQHLHALWQLQTEGAVRIVALADPRPENLEADKLRGFVPGYEPDGIGLFTSFEELMRTTQINALYLCIPPGFHAGEAVEAARCGMHVFVEKPMSLYLDEALSMEMAIATAGVVAAGGFQRRYEAAATAAHEFLRNKRMVMVTMVSEGFLEMHSVKHTDTARRGGPRDGVWAKNSTWSGTSVVEAGIHQTDLMRYWCGDIEWVQAAYVPREEDDIHDGGDNPYAYTVTYGFESGAVGNLLMSRLRKVYRSASYQIAMWDHGHLTLDPEGPVAHYYEGHYPPQSKPAPEDLRHPLPLPEAEDSTLAINRDFITAATAGDKSGLRSSFAGTMNSLVAVLAANVSHELNGERIYLKAFASERRFAPYRQRPSD